MVGTHKLSRYCMENVMENLFSNYICKIDYQNLLNYHTEVGIENFQVSGARIYARLFDESENKLLKSLQVLQRLTQ